MVQAFDWVVLVEIIFSCIPMLGLESLTNDVNGETFKTPT